MTATWRTYRPGDVLRMDRIPDAVLKSPGFCSRSDALIRVYQRAVAKQSRLVVDYIDEWGHPWVEYQFRNKRGRIEFHSFLIDEDAYTKVDTVTLPPTRRCRRCLTPHTHHGELPCSCCSFDPRQSSAEAFPEYPIPLG